MQLLHSFPSGCVKSNAELVRIICKEIQNPTELDLTGTAKQFKEMSGKEEFPFGRPQTYFFGLVLTVPFPVESVAWGV